MSVIEHSATITAIDRQTITVEIATQSACHSCHLKGNCGIFDCSLRSLQIYSPTPERYRLGQTVMVSIAESYGWAAIFFAYILPLILVLSALLIAWLMTSDETTAAICALIILAPYYLFLMLFRKKFSRRFSFKISD